MMLFSSTMAEGTKDEQCDEGAECTTCGRANSFTWLENHSSESFHPNFAFIDEEEEAIHDDSDEEQGSEKKRKSRTAQIAIQKKASVRILREMFHTLSFIEEYNNGFQSEKEDEDEEEEEETSAAELSDEEDGAEGHEESTDRLVVNRKRKAKLLTKNAAKLSRTIKPSEKEPPEESFVPNYKPLSHSDHLKNYEQLAKINRYFHPITTRTSVERAKEEIRSFLDRNTAFEGLMADEEVIAEEKAMAKGFRGYSRKAEQEKMEKREFEEKRQNERWKFEYYTKRKRKPSPQEVEWKGISSRPFHFVAPRQKYPKDLEGCPFGHRCFICAPLLHAERPYEKDEIYNPSFREVEDEDIFMNECLMTEEQSTSRSRNRAANRESQQIASSLKLSELYHTFQFIENYNKGMIESPKK